MNKNILILIIVFSLFLPAVLLAAADYDLNNDGFVDGDDVNMVLDKWNRTGDLPEDIDDNSLVNMHDAVYLLANWRPETNPTPTPSSLTPTPTPPAGNNLIRNPDFETVYDGQPAVWRFFSAGEARLELISPGYQGQKAVKITANESDNPNLQLYQKDISLVAGENYTLSFWAKSTAGRDLRVVLHKHGDPYTNYGFVRKADLTEDWRQYSFNFIANDEAADDTRFRFWLTPFAQTGDQYFIDQVGLVAN